MLVLLAMDIIHKMIVATGMFKEITIMRFNWFWIIWMEARVRLYYPWMIIRHIWMIHDITELICMTMKEHINLIVNRLCFDRLFL